MGRVVLHEPASIGERAAGGRVPACVVTRTLGAFVRRGETMPDLPRWSEKELDMLKFIDGTVGVLALIF